MPSLYLIILQRSVHWENIHGELQMYHESGNFPQEIGFRCVPCSDRCLAAPNPAQPAPTMTTFFRPPAIPFSSDANAQEVMCLRDLNNELLFLSNYQGEIVGWLTSTTMLCTATMVGYVDHHL
jgi:hypothetical protein